MSILPARRIQFSKSGTVIFGGDDFKEGTLIKSKRTFGVEFEFLIDIPKTRLELETKRTAINKAVPREFGMTGDGSIRGPDGRERYDYSQEIQSPPMYGASGENTIKKFCSDAEKIGLIINDSCGVHVHIGSADIVKSSIKLRRLFATYFVLDYVFLAMMPKHRRRNIFCAPMDNKKALKLTRHVHGFDKGYRYDEIKQVRSVESMLTMFYKREDVYSVVSDSYAEVRYHGVNFHSLFTDYHTIELRYLEGTFNADDILHWTALNQFIIDNANTLNGTQIDALYNTKGERMRIHKYKELTGMPDNLYEWVIKRINMFK